jgi:hypothetical protein
MEANIIGIYMGVFLVILFVYGIFQDNKDLPPIELVILFALIWPISIPLFLLIAIGFGIYVLGKWVSMVFGMWLD